MQTHGDDNHSLRGQFLQALREKADRMGAKAGRDSAMSSDPFVEITTRAGRLMEQVMRTWNPPRYAKDECSADIAQTSAMLAIAYIMGTEFLPCDLTDNQQAAIDTGLRLLNRELNEVCPPSLDEWIDRWESEVERGLSSITREEAEKRYEKFYGRE